MSREFDIVVFGATGVTGRYAVEQVYRVSKTEGFTFAVAGRTEKKVIEALKEVAGWVQEDPESFATSIPIVIADVSDPSSLNRMASRCRIVVNTVGPYRFYGEPVVLACVEEGTNHVDVSGEPSYMELMQLKYHKRAQEKNIYIISACGFDSIPCDSLFSFTKENFRGRLNSVETVLSFKSPKGGHTNTGTWNSAIHGVGNWNDLPPIRKAVMETLFTKPLEKPKFALKSRGVVSTDNAFEGYIVPFLGSDKSVTYKSELFRHETQENYKPVQIQTYFRLGSLWTVILGAFMVTIFGILARFKFGRQLLEDHPALFSFGLFRKGAPRREQLKAKSMSIVAIGKGWQQGDDENAKPTKKIVCEIQGPDPAYIGTSIMLVNSAVCVLKDRAAMPFNGGVLSPGFAFENTSLRKRLEDNGFKYIVKSQD